MIEIVVILVKRMLDSLYTGVVASILKTNNDGNEIQIRLRSISKKEELVKLDWLNRKPLSLDIYDLGKEVSKKGVIQKVLVPAIGFVTLEVVL